MAFPVWFGEDLRWSLLLNRRAVEKIFKAFEYRVDSSTRSRFRKNIEHNFSKKQRSRLSKRILERTNKLKLKKHSARRWVSYAWKIKGSIYNLSLFAKNPLRWTNYSSAPETLGDLAKLFYRDFLELPTNIVKYIIFTSLNITIFMPSKMLFDLCNYKNWLYYEYSWEEYIYEDPPIKKKSFFNAIKYLNNFNSKNRNVLRFFDLNGEGFLFGTSIKMVLIL